MKIFKYNIPKISVLKTKVRSKISQDEVSMKNATKNVLYVNISSNRKQKRYKLQSLFILIQECYLMLTYFLKLKVLFIVFCYNLKY